MIASPAQVRYNTINCIIRQEVIFMLHIGCHLSSSKGFAAMGRYFDGVVFVPSQTAGATDAHHYEIICDTCLRCSPFMTTPEDSARGVHGTDERLAVRSYVHGIRALIHMMTSSCVNL